MIHEDRQTKDRIRATAFSLFLQKGYDNTPIQAIIDAVGIAKGTFYHHFKSKEEMLVDLVEGMSRRVVDALAPIAASDLGAREKILAFSRTAVIQKAEDAGPETVVLVRQMRSKANRLLSDSIDRISTEWILPLYTEVIRQGVREGVFQVRNPELASELAVGAIMSMKNRVVDLFLAITEGEAGALERLAEVHRAIEQALERILGAPEGSLPIYTSVDLRGLMARYSPPLGPQGENA